MCTLQRSYKLDFVEVCGVHTERWISWIVSRLYVHLLNNIRYFVFRVSNIYPLRGGSGVLCAGCVHKRRGGSGAVPDLLEQSQGLPN